MTVTKNETGYSSQVQIELEVNGRLFEVSQVGEDSLILQEDVDFDSGTNARLLITVDGKTKAYPVVIDVIPERSRHIAFSDWMTHTTLSPEPNDVPF